MPVITTHGYIGYCGVCKLITMVAPDNPSRPRVMTAAVDIAKRAGGSVTYQTLDACIAILSAAEHWCRCPKDDEEG